MRRKSTAEEEQDRYLRSLLGEKYDDTYYGLKEPNSRSSAADPIRTPTAPWNRSKSEGKES